jgi:hypothetical protein
MATRRGGMHTNGRESSKKRGGVESSLFLEADGDEVGAVQLSGDGEPSDSQARRR